MEHPLNRFRTVLGYEMIGLTDFLSTFSWDKLHYSHYYVRVVLLRDIIVRLIFHLSQLGVESSAEHSPDSSNISRCRAMPRRFRGGRRPGRDDAR